MNRLSYFDRSKQNISLQKGTLILLMLNVLWVLLSKTGLLFIRTSGHTGFTSRK